MEIFLFKNNKTIDFLYVVSLLLRHATKQIPSESPQATYSSSYSTQITYSVNSSHMSGLFVEAEATCGLLIHKHMSVFNKDASLWGVISDEFILGGVAYFLDYFNVYKSIAYATLVLYGIMIY